MTYNITAVIPARGGSKGIPRKNIIPLGGYPLLYYSILAAQKSRHINRIIVSTEDDEIASIARKFGDYVPFMRSPAAAGDTSMEIDILLDLDAQMELRGMQKPDLVVWLRPTSPFRLVEDIDAAIEKAMSSPEFTCVRSIKPNESRLYVKEGDFLRDYHIPFGMRSMIRRQTMPKLFSVYTFEVFQYANIAKFGEDFLGDKIGYVEIDAVSGMDIDDQGDLNICHAIVKCPELFGKYINK